MKSDSYSIKKNRSATSPQPAAKPPRRERRARKSSDAQIPPAPVPARAPSRRGWLLLVLVGILALGGTWAFFELVVWSRVPSELVGKWVVMEGPDEGGTVDFYRHGTMVAKVNHHGREGIIEARIRVDGKKIHVTTRNQQTGEEGTRVQTILSLDGDRLVLEDERGMSVKMRRAK
jgi:uncharacterized protein (TIGR03066 family)